MSSKTHRLKVRARRRRNRANTAGALDPHTEVVIQSLASALDAVAQFAKSDNPVADIDAALAELVEELVARLCSVDPTRVIEVARLACLPWSHDGRVPAGSQNGPTQAELIALITITAAHSAMDQEASNSDARPQDEPLEECDAGSSRSERERKAEPDRVSKVVNEAVPLIDRILELGQLREWQEQIVRTRLP